ncbi:MAG: M55 family metallopeptidase [Clostridia bacterium]|nr:M55 family metallopeptidase [Clostridia bacterium]
MEYLISVDLEGIHGVVGAPFEKLSKDSPFYAPAAEAAVLEVNAAAKALFDNGATKVAVWDGHGGGNNMDFTKIDPRVIKIDISKDKFRFDFVKAHNFCGILFIGYHAMEGTPCGVLAHSFNSTAIQYIKLNGKDIGELGVDSLICKSYGIDPLFIASDNMGVEEMRNICPNIHNVITKYGIRRNEAKLRGEDEVLSDIYNAISRAVKEKCKNTVPDFPRIAHLEIRYTRAERADQIYDKVLKEGEISMYRGEDSHVLNFEITRAVQIPKLL